MKSTRRLFMLGSLIPLTGCANSAKVLNSIGAGIADSPIANSLVIQYADAETMALIEQPLRELRELHDAVELAIRYQDPEKWFADNWFRVQRASFPWNMIVKALLLQQSRTNDPIPDRLNVYRDDIEAGYGVLQEYISKREYLKTMLKLAAITAQILAVKKQAEYI